MILSVVSPMSMLNSISEMLNSEVAPGAKAPLRSSRTSVSMPPAEPEMLIVSVLVVVAPPHAVGT